MAEQARLSVALDLAALAPVSASHTNDDRASTRGLQASWAAAAAPSCRSPPASPRSRTDARGECRRIGPASLTGMDRRFQVADSLASEFWQLFVRQLDRTGAHFWQLRSTVSHQHTWLLTPSQACLPSKNTSH
eukprot:5691485-Pleurochrysis_carterae.AAC.1